MKKEATFSFLAAIVITILASAPMIKHAWDQRSLPVSDQEQKIVAETLLAEKLSGPRYFNVPVAGIREEGGPWIEVSEAWKQVPRVVAERKLSPAATRELERIIGEVTEEPPSRITGTNRINVSRLNLSLDSLPVK